jgi:hypothetical protein
MRYLSRILTRSRELSILLSSRPFATRVNFYITSPFRMRNDDTSQILIKDKTRGICRFSFRNSVKKWTGKYCIFVKRSLWILLIAIIHFHLLFRVLSGLDHNSIQWKVGICWKWLLENKVLNGAALSNKHLRSRTGIRECLQNSFFAHLNRAILIHFMYSRYFIFIELCNRTWFEIQIISWLDTILNNIIQVTSFSHDMRLSIATNSSINIVYCKLPKSSVEIQSIQTFSY